MEQQEQHDAEVNDINGYSWDHPGSQNTVTGALFALSTRRRSEDHNLET
jgi:hypothetical protein